jgi:hypothetical protein
MKPKDLVIINKNHDKILNEDMKKWVENHKNKIFCVERSYNNSTKLYGVNFWISNDLLRKINE